MPSEIETFRDFIRNEPDYELGQPATEEAIAAFEARYNIVLPPDVREYFLKINGSNDGGFIGLEALDDWCLVADYEYFPPDYLNILRSKLDEPEKYFRFGHYDILVWDWLIKLNADASAPSPVVVVKYDHIVQIADSLTDFLQRFRTTYPPDDTLLGYA